MGIPGFTAQQSLVSSGVEYHYAGAVTPEGVSPEFLDFIKEAFESVGGEFGSLIQQAAVGVKNAVAQLNQQSQSSGGRQFDCGGFVMSALQCNGRSPLMASAQLTQMCIRQAAEAGPAAALACGALGASLYPVLVEYCKSPGGKDRSQIAQKACSG